MTYTTPTLNISFMTKEDILSFSDDRDAEFEGLSPDGSGMGTNVSINDIIKTRIK